MVKGIKRWIRYWPDFRLSFRQPIISDDRLLLQIRLAPFSDFRPLIKCGKNKSPKANHWVVKSCLIYQSIWFHPDVRYSRAKIVLIELQEDIYESGPDNMSVDEWRTFARKPHWMVSLWSSAWIMIRRWSMISLLESVRDCRQSFFVLS